MINFPPVPPRPGTQLESPVVLYDIRVLAFEGEPARTVRGLCQLFGVDTATAQRVLVGAPAVVQRQVPHTEAERCAEALRSLGARVSLVPVQDTTVERPISSDLEYDVLSAIDAAIEPAAAADPSLRDLGRELSLEEALDEAPRESSATRPVRHEEFDLEQGAPASDPLELDAAAGKPYRQQPSAAVPRSLQPTITSAAAVRAPTAPRPQAQQPTGPQRPMSAAAVVQHTAPTRKRTREIALLQLLLAMAVFATGHWTDSSPLYGNAGWFSVFAHGLALQQLLYAVRGFIG